MKQNNHSIKNRFFASVLGNISKSGISFLTAILLAKWLGPKIMVEWFSGIVYCLYAIIKYVNSDAFFTFISKRQS